MRRLNCCTKCRTSKGNIFGSFAQRRNTDGKHVQTVEQILAELLLIDHRRKIAIGRRDQPRVAAMVRVPPSRSNSRSCKTRRSFGCSSRGISPISSRNTVPWGQLEPSDALRDRARERASFVAEKLAFEQPCGNRRAVQLDERIRCPAN